MRRRIISLLVSMVLILSMVPMTAMAAGTLITAVAVGVDGSDNLTVDTTAAGSTVSVNVDGVNVSGTNTWVSTNVITAGSYDLTITASKGGATEVYTATINVTASTVPGETTVVASEDNNSATITGISLAIVDGKLAVMIYGTMSVGVTANVPGGPGTTQVAFEEGNYIPHWVSTENVADGYTATVSTKGTDGETYSATITVSITPDTEDLSAALADEDWQYSVVLTLSGLGLSSGGGSLGFANIPSNPDGTMYKVVVGSTTDNNLDAAQFAAYSIPLAGYNIGDVITVTVTASHPNADEDVTKTLTRTVTVKDYMEANEYSYAIKVVADSGVSGYTFSPNYVGTNGGYYFFSGNETTITIAPVLYYSVSSATIDNGDIAHKNTLHGIASYEIELPTATSNPESNSGVVATVTIKTGKTTIGDTAPTHYYTIKAYAGTGGTISPSGSVSVPNGGNQSFIIVPNSGYEIESVVVDGVNRGALSAFTFTDVDADHSIIASFKKVSGTVTPTQPGTTLPPIITPPTTIPATGATTMVLPGVALLLAGIALLPKRRNK